MISNNKILIIDDDYRNIFALSAVLKAKGYHCMSASDASAGINMLLQDQEISIVLMDMMMPEMDGYEAISHIRANDKLSDIIIIAVTAQAMHGDKERCLEAGADDYISKPVNVDRLIEVLQHFKSQLSE